jgi:hypothetical protein
MKNFFIISLLIMVATSCTERIEIELDTTFTRLVVEGHITTDTTTHWVRLTSSTDYYSSTPAPPVSGAVIKLDNGDGDIIMTESDSLQGYYFTSPDYYGEPGKTYTLNIELEEEIGGNKSFSSSCKINPIGTIDSIRVEYNEDWEGWEVQIFAWEPPTTDFYQFRVLKNDTLVTDTINHVCISDDRFFNGNYTNGIMVGFLDEEKPDEIVKPCDKITLEMSSITREYYDFIFELQDQTFEYRNPLFSGPPANISTNIENGSGFFASYSVVRSSTIYQ